MVKRTNYPLPYFRSHPSFSATPRVSPRRQVSCPAGQAVPGPAGKFRTLLAVPCRRHAHFALCRCFRQIQFATSCGRSQHGMPSAAINGHWEQRLPSHPKCELPRSSPQITYFPPAPHRSCVWYSYDTSCFARRGAAPMWRLVEPETTTRY